MSQKQCVFPPRQKYLIEYIPPVIGESLPLPSPRPVHKRRIRPESRVLPELRKKLRTQFNADYPLAHIMSKSRKTKDDQKLPEIYMGRKIELHDPEKKLAHSKLPIQTEYMFSLRNILPNPPHDGFFWITV